MRRRSRRARERGAIGAMIAVLAPVIIALVGLVYDGGLALEGRQRALDIAEQAARAAGNDCDEALLRSRSECLITDQAGIQRIVEGYMGNGVSLAEAVRITDNNHTVVVRTRVQVRTVFLGLFGVHQFDMLLPARRATAVTGLA
jgi:Flp pilus assembly protein TadG